MHKLFTKRKLIVLVILIILIILVGIISRPKAAAGVETQTIKRGDIIESLAATGTIDAQTSVDLSFPAIGKLVYLGVKKGDFVKKGQVIAVLDQRSVQKTLQDDLTDYMKQRNTFDQIKDDNQNRTPEQALNDKMKRILQNNQYDLDKAVFSVELQSLAKEQSVLTSPIDGIVTRADAQTTGLNVSPTTVFSIASPEGMVFKIDIDEADIGSVKQGQLITVTLDAYPEKALHVVVDAIDFATHTTSTGGNAYTVETTLPENNLTYRVGMGGDAEVILNQTKDVLTVPLASLIDDTYVYVLKPEGIKKQKIKMGLKNDTDAEVMSGLSEKDEVALDPVKAEQEMKKKKYIFF